MLAHNAAATSVTGSICGAAKNRRLLSVVASDQT
jgi:hypothetical protein